MKSCSLPLATSCSSPKRNMSALRTACAKAIKRHNYYNDNNNTCFGYAVRCSTILDYLLRIPDLLFRVDHIAILAVHISPQPLIYNIRKNICNNSVQTIARVIMKILMGILFKLRGSIVL